jgi:PAS domain S-box-containing protein
MGGTWVLAQGIGGIAFYLICAIIGLIVLGMAANEWRRLAADDYRRISIAAGVLLLGRLVGLLVLWAGRDTDIGLCLEWFLEGLTLMAFAWAYLFNTFATRQRSGTFLVVALTMVGGSLVLCLLPDQMSLSFSLPGSLWPLILLVLSGFVSLQWALHRRQSSPWLGCAFLVSMLGAGLGLVGVMPLALLGHLAALPLFAIEIYHTILSDLGAYERELQAVSERTLRQTQNMAFLLEVSQTVTASLDMPVVLDRVAESVARAVNADWAYVILPANDGSEEFAVAARYGWWGRRWTQDSQVHRQVVIRLGEYSLLRHAILRRRQVMANQPEDYEQFDRLHDLLARPQTGPTLVQPIYLQGRTLGAVLLGHVDRQALFSEADGRLCQALATQVATAIDNARLYQSLDEQAQRLAALLRVREEEATQRQAILESIAEGVVVAGEGGEVVLANAAAERTLGVPRKELIGRTIKRLYAEMLLSGGRRVGNHAVFEWGDKVVMGSLAPVKMPDETLLGYVAVFRDVTREQQAEQSKAKFVATISHELRTPMTSIKGYIELLNAGAAGNVNPQQRHFLEIVQANTERMVGLVNNLIAVSEMEQGPIKIEPCAVDLAQVIKESVQAMRADAAKRDLDLTMNLPPELCPARGDPQRLRQIMDNLLENALRYTASPGRIAVWATEAHLEEEGISPQHYLVVSVRDTGVGIPLKEQERIFEKFYRVDNPLSTEAGGAGMGLAIVKSLVDAHAGRVWVESKIGAGSTFSFVIPAFKPGEKPKQDIHTLSDIT